MCAVGICILDAKWVGRLGFEVDAPPKAAVQDLLQLPHLFLHSLELGLQRVHFFVNGLCGAFEELEDLWLW